MTGFQGFIHKEEVLTMKPFTVWMEKYFGIILMLSCMPVLVLITVNYFDVVSENAGVAMFTAITVILLNALVVLARINKRNRNITYTIWIIYLITMGVLFLVNLMNLYSNDLGVWIIYLVGTAYYFLLGFEYEYESRRKRLL